MNSIFNWVKILTFKTIDVNFEFDIVNITDLLIKSWMFCQNIVITKNAKRRKNDAVDSNNLFRLIQMYDFNSKVHRSMKKKHVNVKTHVDVVNVWINAKLFDFVRRHFLNVNFKILSDALKIKKQITKKKNLTKYF